MAAIPFSPTMQSLQALDSYRFMKSKGNSKTLSQVEAAARDYDAILLLKYNFDNSITNYNLIYNSALAKYSSQGVTDLKKVLADESVKGAKELVYSAERQYAPKKNQLDPAQRKYTELLIVLNKEYEAAKKSGSTGGGGATGVPADIAALQAELAGLKKSIPAAEAKARQMEVALNGRALRNISKKDRETLEKELKDFKFNILSMKARQDDILTKLNAYGASISKGSTVPSTKAPSNPPDPMFQSVINATNPARPTGAAPISNNVINLTNPGR